MKQINFPFLIFASFALLLAFCAPLQAQTIRYVSPSGSGNLSGTSWANASPNIQDMIDAASPGTQIWVKDGTYLPTKDPFGNANPTNPRDKTFYMKEGVQLFGSFAGNETSITQRTRNIMDANPSTLSGDIGVPNSHGDNCYHVIISVLDGTPFSTYPTILNGFNVEYGSATYYEHIVVEGVSIVECSGAGLYIAGGATRVDSCRFQSNNGGYGSSDAAGSAIFNTGGGNISNCMLYSNSSYSNYWGASGKGGAIYNDGGGKIISCEFANNYANRGGALYIDDATEVTNCLFYNNSIYSEGGAIYCNGNVNIQNCKFANNNGSNQGVIYNNSLGKIKGSKFINNTGITIKNVTSIANIENCIFYNNTGTTGGAVLNLSSNATVKNCIFSQNAATEDGGGVYNGGSANIDIYNCTFSNNASANIAGAIYNENTNANTVNIYNSIIWGNTGSLSQGVGGQASIGASLIQGTTIYAGQGNINPTNGPLFIDDNNIIGNDNTWFTSDDGEGLRLQCSSSAIDMGNNSKVVSTSDITGITPRIVLNSVDMGAYELPSTANISSNSATNELNCLINSIVISATGGGTYSWNTGATTPSITVTTPGTYTVTITNSGCVVTLSKVITQNIVTPAVGVNATPNATLCPQQTQILAGTGAVSYQWSNGIMDNTPFTPTDTMTYTVIGTAANGCTASASYTVYVAEMPTISVIGFNTLICNFAGSGVTYQWNQNGSPQGGATSQTYIPPANGQYSVTVFTNNPVCSTTSNVLTISNVGIEDNSFSGLLVYPNPTKDKLFIENLLLDSHLSLQSIIGGKILWENTKVNASSLTIDMQNLPTGVYFLSLEQKGQKTAWKVIKE